MSLLLRRSFAFVGGLTALATLAVGALLWDSRVDGLYGWDSVHVGYWVIAGVAIVTSTLMRQPLTYPRAGLRLVLLSGDEPTVLHRLTRSLLFWLMVTSPSTLGLGGLFDYLPIATRERFLGSFSIGMALMVLPGVSVLLSGGRSSVHDFVVGTAVVRAEPRSVRRLIGANGRTFGARYYSAVLALLLAGVMSSVMLVDWHYRLSDTTAAYFRERQPYVSEVIRGLRAEPNQAFDLIRQSSPTDNYLNPDGTAFLAGQTESFRFRVSPYVLNDHLRRIAGVLESVGTILPALSPQTKWLDIQLYTVRGFGPVVLESSYYFLVDRHGFKVRYAPVSQRFVFGKRGLTFREWLTHDSTPDSLITVFDSKIHRSIEIMNMGWQFPHLDFLPRPGEPASRFVGYP